jgi:hypothetical protein
MAFGFESRALASVAWRRLGDLLSYRLLGRDCPAANLCHRRQQDEIDAKREPVARQQLTIDRTVLSAVFRYAHANQPRFSWAAIQANRIERRAHSREPNRNIGNRDDSARW